MLSLAASGYTAAAVDAALHAGALTWGFRYELLDSTRTFREALGAVAHCSVSQSYAAQVQRTARITMLDDAAVNWGSDLIRPYARLTMPDGGAAEWPLGTFLLSTPPVTDSPAGLVRDVSCYDLGQVLLDDAVTDRYAVAAGAVVTTAITTLLTGAGITAQNVVASAATLPVTREWELGTTKAQIIAGLIDAIGYEPLWFDALGVAQVRPFVALDQRPVEYTYANDSLSVLRPGVQRGIDYMKVPNVIVAVVSEPDRSVLTSTYTNSNPASPTSTVNRGGRQIVQVIRNRDAVDQTTLDAIARNAAQAAGQVYEEVSFSTAIMPFHASGDVLRLTHSRLGVSAAYQETAWSFECNAGAEMKHTARRIVAV